MEKLLYNAYRFSAANSARVDIPGQQQGQLTGDGRYGFDCSGFVYYLLKRGGYKLDDYLNVSGMINQSNGSLTAAAAKWQTPINTDQARAGDLVYFEGHVGIVVAYNPETGMGIYRSSTSGYGVTDQPFSTVPGPTWWGTKKQFVAFTRIDETKYDNDADTWKNSYGNTMPALQAAPAIPSANNPNPSAYANSWLTQTAYLESRGQANRGYDAINNTVNKAGVITNTALGKYQVMEKGGALTALGYTDKQGNWLIGSREEFLANPSWQEAVVLAYANKLKGELQDNGAWDYVGKTIGGHVITEEGLVAAAWQFGSAGTKRNLALLDSTLDYGHVIPKGFLGRLDSFRGTALPGSTTASGALGSVSGSNVPVPGSQLRIPFGGGNSVTHSSDGSSTYGYTAKSDATGSVVRQGDLVSITFDKDGHFVSQAVWHQDDGSIETFVRNVDGSEETYSRWAKDGTLQTQKTTKVGDGTPVGEFVRDGQRYRADGTPIVDPDVTDIPANIDPSAIYVPTEPIPTEAQMAQALQSEFAGTNYGLGEMDVSQLPETALGFVPTGNANEIVEDLVARGYSVEQNDSSLIAHKDDEYLIISDGAVEIIKGSRYARIDVENASLVLIDTEHGDETRYVLSELAGKPVLLKGHVSESLADDTDPNPSNFQID